MKQRQNSDPRMRKAKRRQAPTGCSREIVFEQQATLSQLRAEVECALREGDSLTSIAQVRFQYIMQCLPLTQKYLFEKDDPQKTTERNLLGNIFNMVSYASASALRIHRPYERPQGGRCPVRQCRQKLSLLVHSLSYFCSTHCKQGRFSATTTCSCLPQTRSRSTLQNDSRLLPSLLRLGHVGQVATTLSSSPRQP